MEMYQDKCRGNSGLINIIILSKVGVERAFFSNAGSVVGCQLVSLEEVVDRRMQTKLQTILDHMSHPHHEMVGNQRSSFV